MDGENAYECSYCGVRRPAIRKTELSEPPTVLSLQLLRNIYDRVTYQKVKLKVSIINNFFSIFIESIVVCNKIKFTS